MNPLGVTEIKAFVPAKHFELPKQFYKNLGFTMTSEGGGVAYFHLGHASFLLQDFCKSLANNFMMRLLVENVDAGWQHVAASDLVSGITLIKRHGYLRWRSAWRENAYL